MFDAQETSYEKAVEKYISENPDKVKEWVGAK
jgi:glycine betaine/proline transport system substrate-binding protein